MSSAPPEAPRVSPLPAGRYVEEAPLGRGAWGTVYRARDTVIGRTVALKVIPFDAALPEADLRELAARCGREARAAGVLNHPNVVTIHDAGLTEESDAFVIVMELVEGTTLRARLDRGPVPPAEAASIARQVAAALAYAHERGIVHRDVKPANILLRADGVAKLADFGIARVHSSDLTRTGFAMGSPAYMAPEQLLGRPAEARSDVFALGVVLYEMLAGRRPFEADSAAGLGYQIVNVEPEPPSRRAEGLSPDWDALVLRMMAKRPEDRCASASEVVDALGRAEPGEMPAAAAAPPAAPGPYAGAPPVGTVRGAGSGLPGAPPRSRGAALSRRALIRTALVAAGALVLLAAAALPARGRPGGIFGGRPGRVEIDLVHGVKTGTVTVEVDETIVWRQAIAGDGEGFRPFLRRVAGRPAGRASGRIRVRPGERAFRVTVESTSDGERWTETTRARIEAGSTPVLKVKVRTGLTRGMELEWE